MEKHRHRQRERRHVRSKQFDQDVIDHQNSLRNREILATSATRGKNRNIMRDEDEYHLGATAFSRLPQDDFVHKWLAQTTLEDHLPLNAEDGSRKKNVSCSIGPEGLSRGLDFEQFVQGDGFDSNKERANIWQQPRKHMLESSSECSFLERAFTSNPRPEAYDADKVVGRIEMEEISKSRRQRRKLERSISLRSSVVSLSINPRVKPFERRRRNKTRKDRYEPKRALVDANPRLNRQKKREKKMKSKSRRKVLRNGEDLMHQFSSNSVGLDRLTMPPSHTVGLFRNGRASSPRRRRGLPDLAFSEMGFLRRSKQRPPEMEEDKSLSKSRERERQRSERAQNEISKYFKPSRMLRVEVERADRRHQSYKSIADHKLRQRFPTDRGQSNYTRSTSCSVDMSKDTLLRLDQRHAFEQLARRSHSRGQMVQRGSVPDTGRNLSDKVTSYYTWSDSARSPEVSQSKRNICSEVSTTPESIRRMLNDTGIFTYTGMDRNISRPYETTSNEPVESILHIKPSRLSRISHDVSPITNGRKTSPTSSQSQCQIEEAGKVIPKHCSSHQEVRTGHMGESASRDSKGGKILRPPKAIVQHYIPEVGLQQNLANDEAKTHAHLSKENLSKQDISRKAIARQAYVKQASKTGATVLGNDNTNSPTLSVEMYEARTMMPHQQYTEQLIHEERNAEITDHSVPLSSREKNIGEVIFSTRTDGTKSPTHSHINDGPNQASKAAISGSLSERQLDTMLVTERVTVPSNTLETMPDLPITHQQVNGGLDQTDGTSFEGRDHSAACANDFKGLPVRGSRPSGTRGQISASHAVFTPVEVEPLYSYQLEKRISQELAEQNYEEDDQKRQLLRRFDTTWMESSPDEEGELYERFEGEYELLNSTANLQDFDVMLSEELDSGAYMVQEEEEEERTPWGLYYQDMTLQAAAQQQPYQRAQHAGFINQQQFPVMDATPDREVHHYHPSCAPFRELAQAEEAGLHHQMNRFWQPRRQY